MIKRAGKEEKVKSRFGKRGAGKEIEKERGEKGEERGEIGIEREREGAWERRKEGEK